MDNSSVNASDTQPAGTEATSLAPDPNGNESEDDDAEGAEGSETVTGIEGAVGLEDPYYPSIGNGGYDVTLYDLALTWNPRLSMLSGTVTITADALEPLDTFNLDLGQLEVEAVVVDGVDAEYNHRGGELEIDPDEVVDTGEFEVAVTYSGDPVDTGPSNLGLNLGWQFNGEYAYVISEPNGSSSWFPSNDHPSDKAAYEFHIEVPSDLEVAVSGQLVSIGPGTVMGTQVHHWSMPDPMATYLVTIAVGEFTIVEETTESGLTIRNYFPPHLADDATIDFADTAAAIGVLEELFGPYPFDQYGVVVVDEYLGLALETQTLSIFGTDWVSGFGDATYVVVHELAHQWVGNSVTPDTWQDIWLNEGFASYTEWLYFEATDPTFDIDQEAAYEHEYVTEYVEDSNSRPIGDPGSEELFDLPVYYKGRLALHALRLEIGDDAFFETLRAWTDRFAYANASTADFEALAAEISGMDLAAFFEAWLRKSGVPPLPDPVPDPVAE